MLKRQNRVEFILACRGTPQCATRCHRPSLLRFVLFAQLQRTPE
jgi:hypothetical protein